MKLFVFAAGALLAITPAGAEPVSFNCVEHLEASIGMRVEQGERHRFYVADEPRHSFASFTPGRGIRLDYCLNMSVCHVEFHGATIDASAKSSTFKRHLILDRDTGEMTEVVGGNDNFNSSYRGHCSRFDYEHERPRDAL